METSKILGCNEECSSSVSGWTIYIGSPLPENDNYHDDDDDHRTYCQGEDCTVDNHGDDDDDANAKSDNSMESDASSGPSSKLSLDKHATSKLSSKEKLHKQKMKKNERRIKVARDEPESKAKGAPTQARSGDKVRKAN